MGKSNFGLYPMITGQSRLGRRFYDEAPALDADAAFKLGLVTAGPDDIDWDDEVCIALEERVAMSPDALTGLEANLSLTIKRVLQDHDGQAVRGVGSNYMCDLKVGDKVQVIGPFGASFLMPNHPRSSIVMICTGTGSAPMRAMTEWRRRLRRPGKFEGGKLMLFFGARTQEELPYFGPLQSLPADFIDINFAFSRTPGQARRYVQDRMRERAADLGALLQEPDSYFFVCGLKSMAEGVLLALRDVAQQRDSIGNTWGRRSSAKAGCTWKPIEGHGADPPEGSYADESRERAPVRTSLYK